MRLLLMVALAGLLAADWGVASALRDAVVQGNCDDGRCRDGIDWLGAASMLVLLAGLVWATWRVWIRLRPTLASRPARQS